MAEPFVKRDLYDTSAYIGKETFVSLMQKLEQIGFKQQEVILPANNGVRVKKNTTIPEASKILPLGEFLELDQDFDGIVVRVENTSSREEIVILFRNNLEKILSFTNNIFPYAQGDMSSNFYVSTQDPVRTYGLVSYIKDFFKNEVPNQGLKLLLMIIIGVAMFGGLYIYMTDKFNNKSLSGLLSVGLVLLTLVATSSFFPEKGLRVSSAKIKRNYPPYIEKLRENWLLVLVTAIITIGATIFTQYISNSVGFK